jgi:hypothetical protein
MTSGVKRGALFWWKPQGDPDRHLRIIASDPNGPEVVIVAIESYYIGCNDSCLLNLKGQPKDIQALTWTSIPAYAHCQTMTPQKLTGILASKESSMIDEVMGQPLINRILTAVYRNKRLLRPGVFEALDAMLKANRPAPISRIGSSVKPKKHS